MAEMKFACPSCGQLIACDELWTGQEIQCPICSKSLTVPSQQAAPANPLVPPPPVGPAPKLSIGQHRPPATPPSQTARAQGPRAQGHIMGQKTKKTGAQRAKTFAIWGLVLAAVGAGAYFGWPYLKQYQDKMNDQRRQAERNSDGGEAGHIASLNNVLDATDPGRPGGPRFDVGRPAQPTRGSKLPPGAGMPAPGQPGQAAATETNLPVVPTQFTLDLAAAKIPEGKVNGMISATNFVADISRLDPLGGAFVLRFLQGPLLTPERGIMVYLHLKAGEKLAGHTWDVSADTKGGPQVTKIWKPNPKYAAKNQSYSSGYVLKVELGEIKDGQIPGKIYLAFPDTEQSYAGGVFVAQTTVGAAGTASVAAAPATPVAPVQSSADKAAFDKRYGIGPKR